MPEPRSRAPRGREARHPDGAIGAEATAPVPGRGWAEGSLLLMVFIWGVNFAVVKQALEAFSPLAFNAVRFVVASAMVLVVLRMQGPLQRPAREDWPRLVVLGLVGNLLYQLAFIFGLDRTRAGNASLVLALTPVFTAFLSARSGHERPRSTTWIGAALSVVGVGMVSGSSVSLEGVGDTLVGDLILLGAAVVWSFYTVGSRPLIDRYGATQTTVWTLWAGAVGLVVVGAPALLEQDWRGVSAGAWGGLFFSAFFAIGAAYLIWYRGVERIGNTRTSAFSNLTPVVALLVGAVWLGERLTVLSVLGAALTIGGVMLVRTVPAAE